MDEPGRMHEVLGKYDEATYALRRAQDNVRCAERDIVRMLADEGVYDLLKPNIGRIRSFIRYNS
jgi:hypothetical protein